MDQQELDAEFETADERFIRMARERAPRQTCRDEKRDVTLHDGRHFFIGIVFFGIPYAICVVMTRTIVRPTLFQVLPAIPFVVYFLIGVVPFAIYLKAVRWLMSRRKKD